MEIEIYTKVGCGVLRFYAKDKDVADALQIITGQKSLTERVMEGLSELGHTFKQVN